MAGRVHGQELAVAAFVGLCLAGCGAESPALPIEGVRGLVPDPDEGGHPTAEFGEDPPCLLEPVPPVFEPAPDPPPVDPLVGLTWSEPDCLVCPGIIGPRAVTLGDIDGDGDLDAAGAASSWSHVIVWWEDGADASGDGAGYSWTMRTISPTRGAEQVLLADLDGDDDLDLVATPDWEWAGPFGWWRNGDSLGGGDGTTWTEEIIAEGIDVQGVAVADMDNDGDLDVAVTDEVPSLAWYQNGGDSLGGGGAQGWSRVEVASWPDVDYFFDVDLAASDLDSDGALDLVMSTQTPGTLEWWRNEGGGLGWTAFSISDYWGDPTSLDVSDFDEDGDPDIAATTRDPWRVVWWQNGQDANGGGDGTAWTRSTIGSLSWGADVLGADLDGDGDRDVVAASSSDGRHFWWQNGCDAAGGGAGSVWCVQHAGDEAGYLSALAIGDVDEDGDLDLFGANTKRNRVALRRNGGDSLGSGGAENWTDLSLGPDGFEQVFDVAVEDLDSDGDLDAVAVAPLEGRVKWWENPSGQSAADAWPVHEVSELPGARVVETADLDGDGDLDLLVSQPDWGRLTWLESAGPPLQAGPADWTEHEVSAIGAIVELVITDVDIDGDLDVVAADDDAREIVWFENHLDEPAGGFGARTSIGSYYRYSVSLAAGDIDQDGDSDVVSGTVYVDDNYYSFGLSAWFRNPTVEGDGGWEERLFSYGADAAVLTVADIDADGALDLVGSPVYPGGMWWWRRVAGDHWVAREVGPPGASSVEVSDLDDDGDVDIVGTTWSNELLVWQNGGGASGGGSGQVWSGRLVSDSLTGPRRALAEDLDGDGLEEIVAVSDRADSVVILWASPPDGEAVD
jgi:hypothetical protein